MTCGVDGCVDCGRAWLAFRVRVRVSVRVRVRVRVSSPMPGRRLRRSIGISSSCALASK